MFFLFQLLARLFSLFDNKKKSVVPVGEVSAQKSDEAFVPVMVPEEPAIVQTPLGNTENSTEVFIAEGITFHGAGAGDHLENFNLRLVAGEGIVVLGPEGSGKSLVLDMLMGKKKPEQGTMRFLGENIHTASPAALEKIRSSIGYISHTVGLINNMSLIENIVLPLRYHTVIPEKEMLAMAGRFLDRYELRHKEKARPQLLTNSEALRGAFIRALITEPRLILIDNAFEMQCPLARAKFLMLSAEDMASRQIAFILCAYRPDAFFHEQRRFMLLYRGQVVFAGSGADLYKSQNPFVRQYIKEPLHGPMANFRTE